MGSDQDEMKERFWAELGREFANETRDHLEIMEPMLAGGTDAFNSDEIGQLFRSMHSLKGLARAMDLHAMESIAHVCEDLLGLVRDEGFLLQPHHFNLLLEAIDQLKVMSTHAIQSHEDSPVPDQLIDAIKRSMHIENDDGVNDGKALPEQPGMMVGPLADSDMVQFFGEILTEQHAHLKHLCEMLVWDDGVRVQLYDCLSGIQRAAVGMELTTIGELLNELLFSSADSAHAWILANKSLLLKYAKSLAQIEELIGQSLASSVVYALFPQDSRQSLINLAAALSEVTTAEGFQPLLKQVEDCEVAMPAFKDFWAFLQDWLSRSELSPEDRFDQRSTLLAALARMQDNNAENSDTVLDYVRGGLHLQATTPPKDLAQWMRGNRIDPANWRELLQDHHVAQLLEAMAKQKNIYAVKLFPDRHPEAEQSFFQWVTQHANPILSRTLSGEDQHAHFEFLILSDLVPELMKSQVSHLKGLGSAIQFDFSIDAVAATHEEFEPAIPKLKESAPVNSTLRIESATLDRFMNQLGELTMVRGTLSHSLQSDTHLDEFRKIQRQLESALASTGQIDKNMVMSLRQAIEHGEQKMVQLKRVEQQINGALSRLQQEALNLRVVPVSTVFNRLPRLVRDLAIEQGKSVKLKLLGEDVKLDKSMVETLTDPLIHMVRNSIDHGIEWPAERLQANKPEQAVLTVKATQRSDSIWIEVMDDGRGINVVKVLEKALARGLITAHQAEALSEEKIYQLIFAPGLSTADRVSETSGRGVGMDVVKSTVNRLGGEIVVSSRPGEGSCIRMQIPLTAAIQSTLLVKVNTQIYAISDKVVREVLEGPKDLQTVQGQEAIILRGQYLPVVHLQTLLHGKKTPTDADSDLVILSQEGKQLGVFVDKVLYRDELFLKEMHSSVSKVPGLGGVSVLGNGDIVLILDAEWILLRASRSGGMSKPAIDAYGRNLH